MWASRSKWPNPPTPSKPTPTRSPLEPGPPSSRGRRGQGTTIRRPGPLHLPRSLHRHPPPPSPLQRAPPPPCTPQGRANMESPEEPGQGEKVTQGEAMGQDRLRLPQMVPSAKGGKGKDKRERIIVVVRSPCQEKPADAHTSAQKSMLESANLAWTRSVHLDAPGQRHGQQPVSGSADPGVVKQDKSSRGSVDTTKRRSDPQRVGMNNGERPMGAANYKQTNHMASCQTPPLQASCQAPSPPRKSGFVSPPTPLGQVRRGHVFCFSTQSLGSCSTPNRVQLPAWWYD